MKYEVIPQREYLIDGFPARTYGDWPGIKPNKFNGSVRIIHPVEVERVFDDREYKRNFGRRHFSELKSKEYEYNTGKKSKKDIMKNIIIPPKKNGIKKINYTFSENKYDFEKKHFEHRFGYEKIPEPPFQIKTFKPDGNYCSTKEMTIEDELGKKNRIYTIWQQRNYIDYKTPGDHFYKTNEYFPRFFHEGGLIVGSTNRINYNKTHSKKGNNFYETINLNIPVLDKNKLWKNKLKNEEIDDQINYVGKTITDWEKNILLDYFPDFNKKNKEEVKEDNKKKINPKDTKAKGKKK
jgi:hypothetical protein